MSGLTKEELGLIRQVYEGMWNSHDPSMARRLFERPEGVEDFVGRFLKAFPDLEHTVEDLIAEDDRVAVRFSARGTHRGTWMDVDATGRPIHYTGVTIAHIGAGKLGEHRTWWDTWDVMRQIQAP